MYFPLVLCALLSLNFVYSEQKLKECEKSECPDYVVVEKKENYEIRKYPGQAMAFVEHEGLAYDKARRKMFFKLYRYQQGANEQHHSFPMVYPFLTQVKIGLWTSSTGEKKEVVETKKFGMGFLIPKKLHDSPPKPTKEEDAVELEEIPEKTVYAVSFPGFANRATVMKLQAKLHADLEADGVEFDRTMFMVAEYNKINQLWGRHNDAFYIGK